jgi:hypothetical protein
MEINKTIILYTRFRDWIYDHTHGSPDFENSLFGTIAFKTFGVSYNLYKAVGLLLPELYYEAAAILVRSIWEHSLMLHYMESLPSERAQQFAEFTLIEFARQLPENERRKFESVIADRLKKYQSSRSKQQDSYFDVWSGESVYKQAKALGGNWISEYKYIYRLGSAHVHPTPGAIIFSGSNSTENIEQQIKRDRDRTGIIALESVNHMRKLCQLVWRHAKLYDAEILTDMPNLLKTFKI